MSRFRLPHKLKLLSGLRWTGSMALLSADDGGYVVAFNAEGIDSGAKQFIYDRAVLTAKQVHDWTGWKKP